MKSTSAFLFPGQGAQYPGMGKDFVSSYPAAKETLEEADELLGRKLSDIILSGPESLLTETKNSQVAIYVISYAILRVVQQLFPELKPNYCAGLSLGEYTAASCAGFFSFANGISLVQQRGIYMNEACERTKGTMAVILGLSAEEVSLLVSQASLPHDLWAANFNCPGQVVVSGTEKGIHTITALAKEKGAKRVLPLSVHGAFHSGLMASARECLAPHIASTPLSNCSADLVMNVSGTGTRDAATLRENLIEQVTHPVKWEQGIRFIDKQGVSLYLEMGPGKTLAGFNKRIGTAGETISIEKVEDLKQLENACKNY